MTVRRRQHTDLPALADVLVRVYEVDGYPVEGVDDPAAWVVPAGELAGWTAVLNEYPIGHISLTEATSYDDAAQLWIKKTGSALADIAIPVRLFVDPPHRSRGAGRELMLAAYQHATNLGKRMVFDVMLKDKHAIRLYEDLGCQRLGTITHHHSGGLAEPAGVYVAPG